MVSCSFSFVAVLWLVCCQCGVLGLRLGELAASSASSQLGMSQRNDQAVLISASSQQRASQKNDACNDLNPDVFETDVAGVVNGALSVINAAIPVMQHLLKLKTGGIGTQVIGLVFSGVGMIMNMFWGSWPECPVWEATKEAIVELVNEILLDEALNDVNTELSRLGQRVDAAGRFTPGSLEQRREIDEAVFLADGILSIVLSPGWAARRPHFVAILGTLSTIHVTLLFDQWMYAETAQNSDVLRERIIAHVDTYQLQLPIMLEEWKAWRYQQFTTDTVFHPFHWAGHCGAFAAIYDERFSDELTGFHQSYRTCGANRLEPQFENIKSRIVNEGYAKLVEYITPSFYLHSMIPPKMSESSSYEPVPVQAKVPFQLRDGIPMGPVSFFTTGQFLDFELDLVADRETIYAYFDPTDVCENPDGYRRIAVNLRDWTGPRVQSVGVGDLCTLGRQRDSFDDVQWFGGAQDDQDNDNFIQSITWNFVNRGGDEFPTVAGLEAKFMDRTSTGLIGGVGGSATEGIRNNVLGIPGFKITKFYGGRAAVHGENVDTHWTLVSVKSIHQFHGFPDMGKK